MIRLPFLLRRTVTPVNSAFAIDVAVYVNVDVAMAIVNASMMPVTVVSQDCPPGHANAKGHQRRDWIIGRRWIINRRRVGWHINHLWI